MEKLNKEKIMAEIFNPLEIILKEFKSEKEKEDFIKSAQDYHTIVRNDKKK